MSYNSLSFFCTLRMSWEPGDIECPGEAQDWPRNGQVPQNRSGGVMPQDRLRTPNSSWGPVHTRHPAGTTQVPSYSEPVITHPDSPSRQASPRAQVRITRPDFEDSQVLKCCQIRWLLGDGGFSNLGKGKSTGKSQIYCQPLQTITFLTSLRVAGDS